MGGFKRAADLGWGRAVGVKGLGRVAGRDDVWGTGDDYLELSRGDILDFVHQDVAVLRGRVEEVVDRPDFHGVSAGFCQTHGGEIFEGVSVGQIAYLRPAVLLEQKDSRVRQDDGLSRSGVTFDPVPSGDPGSGLADDGSLGRGEVFEGYEPVHKILLNHWASGGQTYWDAAWASPLHMAYIGQFTVTL